MMLPVRLGPTRDRKVYFAACVRDKTPHWTDDFWPCSVGVLLLGSQAMSGIIYLSHTSRNHDRRTDFAALS